MQLPVNKTGAIIIYKRGLKNVVPDQGPRSRSQTLIIVHLRSREWEAQLIDDPHRSRVMEPAHLQQLA